MSRGQTPCQCGLPPWTYSGAPCCYDRFVEALHQQRPALAFWYMATVKPPVTDPFRQVMRDRYRGRA
jgi:hypothetical protein